MEDSTTTTLPPPPFQLVHCLVHWLKSTRQPSKTVTAHHSTPSTQPSPCSSWNWTSIDWVGLVRRYKLSSLQLHFSIEQILTFCPPIPICLASWTIFGALKLSRYYFCSFEMMRHQCFCVITFGPNIAVLFSIVEIDFNGVCVCDRISQFKVQINRITG